VDDGSPDKSGVICEKIARSNEKIHVIHQENKGQIAARMAGIKFILENKQPNSFVCFLDSDDTYEAHALQTIYESIEEHCSDMVIFNLQRVCNGNIIGKKNRYSGIVTDKGELYKIVLSDPSYNSLCLKAISINLINNIDYSSYYHIRHAEDMLQSLHYYKCCRKVAFINSVLYNYTTNNESVTQSVSASNYCFNSEARNYVWDFLQKENIWNVVEMQDYAVKMHQLIEGEIMKISKFRTSMRKKIKFFKTIESDEYCKKLFYFPVKTLILRLFIARNYRMLIFIINAKYKIATIFRNLK
jgi:glycosyltransferase involved in cell wall biosynthesis